jgi:hypothetical protein
MSDDFTMRLRLQLREAALREERRGALGRRLAAVRPSLWPLSAGTAAAAAAVGLVLVLALGLVTALKPETAAPPSGPRVVADALVAGGLGQSAVAGFGSVWLSDSDQGQILRVDPRTRRVTARIPVGADVNMDVADGSVWAAGVDINRGPLLRIDPRTGRIIARIPMRTPGGGVFQGGFVIAAPSRVWVIGNGGIAVDPVNNRVVAQIRLGGDFHVVDAHVQGGELWLTRADKSVTRFDAVTGRRLGRTQWTARGFMIPYADKLVSVGPAAVELIDPASGRALWSTRIGRQLNDATIAAGRLIVEGSVGTGPDRMWELDPRTGRVLGTLTVPGFSVLPTLTVGREVWTTTAGGHVVVVSR